MSDQRPPDDWSASPRQDTVDLRRADELELFLAAALAHETAPDTSRHSDDALLATPGGSHPTPVSDEQLAYALVATGNRMVPDGDFASDLQAQIERRIRAGGRSDGAEADGNTGVHRDTAVERSRRPTRLQPNWRRFRPLLAALAALVLLSLLLALPPVRASLRRPICIGSVCIVWGNPSQPSTGVRHTPTATPLPTVLDLAGRTTLGQARAQAPFAIRLPTYPADLGQPDAVFLQQVNGTAVVLAWIDHAHPNQVRLSLSELSSGIFVYKFATQPVAVTSVHGQQALWTTGPYLVEIQDGSVATRQLVSGHALIWTEGGITYRLETSVSLADAVRIAESLR